MLFGKTDQTIDCDPLTIVGHDVTAIPTKQLVHFAGDQRAIGNSIRLPSQFSFIQA
jgi:hypothetical protein